MKVRQNNSAHKINLLALVSLAIGILSLLPYLPVLGALLLHAITGSDALLGTASLIPVTVYALAGLLFGSISLIIGERALIQIRKSNNIEQGYGFVMAGKIISVLGVILNLLFGLLFVLLLKTTF